MSSQGAPVAAERALANAGPILFVAAIGLVAVVGLILSLFRDPGLPSYVQDSYMRVAGGLVVPDRAVSDPAAVAAALSAAPPGAVRVPLLQPQGYALAGGTHVELGGTPAALAIYHNVLRDMVTWHAMSGRVHQLPAAPETRSVSGQQYYIHYKASTTIVFWQDGPVVAALTSTLPAEQVMVLALAASVGARP